MLFAGFGLRVQDPKGGDNMLIQTIIKSHAPSTNSLKYVMGFACCWWME